jgi:hypothetical protein
MARARSGSLTDVQVQWQPASEVRSATRRVGVGSGSRESSQNTGARLSLRVTWVRSPAGKSGSGRPAAAGRRLRRTRPRRGTGTRQCQWQVPVRATSAGAVRVGPLPVVGLGRASLLVPVRCHGPRPHQLAVRLQGSISESACQCWQAVLHPQASSSTKLELEGGVHTGPVTAGPAGSSREASASVDMAPGGLAGVGRGTRRPGADSKLQCVHRAD